MIEKAAQNMSETQNSETDKFIEIEKSIAAKNPRLLKFLPSFLIRYIKRMIHQEELNEAIDRNKHRFHLDFVDAAVDEFGVKIKTSGTENIPTTGGILIASNHPLGGLDGLALLKVVGKYRKDVHFMVNDILLALKNFSTIFIPVNKHGRNSPEYMENIEKAYASDECLLVFPAGLVSRRQKGGIIKDLLWKKSFITKSILYKKNILPVFIDGHNSNFFYNLAYWRKKLGIKANIEMFFLVNEMYKQKGKTITYIIGEPISYKTFTPDQKDAYWAEKVKEHVYALSSGDKSKMLPTVK
jgi:putative hemolysin